MDIFKETVEATKINPDVRWSPPDNKPSAQQMKRGKRVTNSVLRKLNKLEVPPPASDTVGIMDDETILDTQEVSALSSKSQEVLTAEQIAEQRKNGLS